MMRALLCRTGRDSLLVQMATFDPGKLSVTQYKKADSLIRRWSEREVSAVSFEAGTFWAWVSSFTRHPDNYDRFARGSQYHTIQSNGMPIHAGG
ncbi:hypothetical protein ElyMa_006023200 [Elysia marginata]|uniref:Uncharacterized protein n=1 Tax=Elysia marginata TaxID=1093978 RepID=A0AAV4GIE2_9GAST|nr:hypothetical protein ElyMa_006023200 [Elysia marginata]